MDNKTVLTEESNQDNLGSACFSINLHLMDGSE